METRTINVNLDEYTIYLNRPTSECIAVDKIEWNRIKSFMNDGRYDHVDESETTKGKVLTHDKASNTYVIGNDFLFEYRIMDLENIVIHTGEGVLR